MEKRGTKTAAVNRKASHDYFIEARYEAGIELCGTEVKSIRQGALLSLIHILDVYKRQAPPHL